MTSNETPETQHSNDQTEQPESQSYFDQPRRLSEKPPKTCGQWIIALLLTGILGIIVLAIWDWDVWKKFALVAWIVLGLWVGFSICTGG